MNCLVTGGAGFIGSYLCDYLLSVGYDVLAVDNFITGNKKNIAHLISNPKFKFLYHDCTKALPENISTDVIFHFASPASPPKYQDFPIETMLVNSYGTYLLLEKARAWKAKFVYASTSEIYGDPLEHPQKETYWGNVNTVGPRSCYDESKRMGETWVANYKNKYKVDATIIRIFNTYGPRMDIDDGRVITNFIKQIKQHQPLTINGDGMQSRSFCYISDLISGIISVFKRKIRSDYVYNIGTDNEITIKDLVQTMKQLFKFKGDVIYQDLPVDDPIRRKPDLTRIKSLGWQPKIDLPEGLKLTFASFS